jgi:hypothetical protein
MAGRGTTGRKVRVDDDLWTAAGDAAARYGTNAGAVMRDALVALVEASALDDALDVEGVEVGVHIDLVPVEVTA